MKLSIKILVFITACYLLGCKDGCPEEFNSIQCSICNGTIDTVRISFCGKSVKSIDMAPGEKYQYPFDKQAHTIEDADSLKIKSCKKEYTYYSIDHTGPFDLDNYTSTDTIAKKRSKGYLLFTYYYEYNISE